MTRLCRRRVNNHANATLWGMRCRRHHQQWKTKLYASAKFFFYISFLFCFLCFVQSTVQYSLNTPPWSRRIFSPNRKYLGAAIYLLYCLGLFDGNNGYASAVYIQLIANHCNKNGIYYFHGRSIWRNRFKFRRI